MDKMKIYNNKLSFNVSKLDKDIKKQIKGILYDVLNTTMEKHKTINEDNLISNSEIRQKLINATIYAMQLNDNDIEKLSNKALKKAIFASYANQLVIFSEKYVKIEGVSVSLSRYFISIQASLVKQIEHEKRQEYLENKAQKQANKKAIKIRK